MSFFQQLYLLLWKNYVLRKRRKVRLAIEILWPLSIVFITAAIRLGVKPVNRSQCHFEQKPLPSSGILTFMRGFVCELDNACYRVPAKHFSEQEFGSFALQSIEYLAENDVLTSSLSLLQFYKLASEKRSNATKIASGLTLEQVLNIPVDTFRELMAKNLLSPHPFDPYTTNLLLKSRPNFNKLYSKYSTNYTDPVLALTGPNLGQNFINWFYGPVLERLDLNRANNYVDDPAWLRDQLCSSGSNHLLFNEVNQASYLNSLICSMGDSELRALFVTISSKIDFTKVKQMIFNQTLAGDKAFYVEAVQAAMYFYNLKEEVVTKNNSQTGKINSVSDILQALSNMTWSGSFCQYSYANIFKMLSSNSVKHSNHNDMPPGFNEQSKQINVLRSFNRFEKLNETNCPVKLDQHFPYSPKKTCFCLSLNALVANQSEDVQVMFKQLKPILFGKVPFAPATTPYLDLIRRANVTFQNLDTISLLLGQVVQLSERFMQKFDLKTAEGFERAKNSLTKFSAEFLDYNLSKSDLATLQKLSRDIELYTEGANFAKNLIQCLELNKFEAFQNESEAVRVGTDRMTNDTFWASVIFENKDNNSAIVTTQLPKVVKYKIRMNNFHIQDTQALYKPFYIYEPSNCLTCNPYMSYGFIYLQDMIEKSVIEAKTDKKQEFGLSAQMTPYPSFIEDFFLSGISKPLPLFIVLAWTYTVASIVRDIVYEKERRLKEFMQIMGLSNGLHWLAWFITTLTVLVFIIGVLTFVMKFGKITVYSDLSAVFVFYMCFMTATIAQCFLISVFFDRANLAAVVTGIIYFLLYLPYMILLNFAEHMKLWHKFVVSLSSTIAFGYGNELIAVFEFQNQGLRWSNFDTTPYNIKHEQFTMRSICLMLLLDASLYMILAWYIEGVWPGEFGVPKRWYFPLQPSYWLNRPFKIRQQLAKLAAVDSRYSFLLMPLKIFNLVSRSKQSVIDEEASRCGMSSNNYLDGTIEKTDMKGKPGIEIQNLHKVYSRKKTHALKGLNVNFYENEISAFLGHNGAGKSTTMHLLTGLYSPTSGTAKINGLDIRESITEIRSQIGFTPQYNVLFSGMTVREHLWFYSRLKGIGRETTQISIDRMIVETGLSEFENERVERLSSGLQRKLSVAIAFVGDSKIVILDEPSAGVDPAGRRSIWDVLLRYKNDRTIVISTHYMDEADVLSDRVVIIAEGKLIAHGTPAYLKKKFGQGYYLTVSKNNDYISTVTSESIRDDLINDFIITRFKTAELIEQNCSEITYSIPNKPEFTKLYSEYFKEVEDNYDRLGITHVKLTDTNLEEIFMKLTEKTKLSNKEKRSPIPVEEDNLNKNVFQRMIAKWPRSKGSLDLNKQREENIMSSEKINSYSEYTKLRIKSKLEAIIQQFYALIVKRYHRIKRNLKGLLAETVLPLVFVCLALLFSNLTPSSTNKSILEIHPWLYANPNLVFMSYLNPAGNDTDLWGSLLDSPGSGTRCLKNHRVLVDSKRLGCLSSITTLTSTSTTTTTRSIKPKAPQHNLNKSVGQYDCLVRKKLNSCENPKYANVKQYKLSTQDVLFDLTGRNLSDWLLQTEFSDKFFQKRYGGFEIDLNLETSRDFLYLKTTTEQLLDSLDQVNDILEGTSGSRLFKDFVNEFGDNTLVAKKSIKVWYNQKGFHANVAYLNHMNNILLRAQLKDIIRSNIKTADFNSSTVDLSEHGIVAYSEPMPLVKGISLSVVKKRVVIDLFVSIFIMFALGYIPAGFLLYLLEERENNFKQLQFISGVKPYIYWLSNYAWDLVNYLVPCIICLILFIVFDSKAYTSNAESMLCVFLLFFLYGWSCIPFMYPFNYFFKTASTAFVYCSSINVFIGVATITISTVLSQLIEEKVELEIITVLNDLFKTVFICLFPHFCLAQGLFDMSIIYYTGEIKKTYGYQVNDSLFKYKNIGRNLIFMFVQGLVFFTLNLLIEYKFFVRSKPAIGTASDLLDEMIFHDQDQDVLNEKNRVLKSEITSYSKISNESVSLGGGEQDYVKLVNLKKVYTNLTRSKQTLAVNSVTTSIKKGECFGLLGFNGAGKTTIFKMMTGHIPITSGEILINGLNVSTQIEKIHKDIGYCPQTNAIIPLLTAREHLVLFARLRSIPEKFVYKVSEWALNRFGLIPFADCVAEDFSGGNKRKLSTAISIIGNPSVVCLDEPTSGINRAKWKNSNCTWAQAQNQYFCKHIIKVAAKLNLFDST